MNPNTSEKYIDGKNDAFLSTHGGCIGKIVGFEEEKKGDEDGEEKSVVMFEVQDEVKRKGTERQSTPHSIYTNYVLKRHKRSSSNVSTILETEIHY